MRTRREENNNVEMEELQQEEQATQWRPTLPNLGMAAMGVVSTGIFAGVHNSPVAVVSALATVAAFRCGDQVVNIIRELSSREGREALLTSLQQEQPRGKNASPRLKEDRMGEVRPNIAFEDFDNPEDESVPRPDQRRKSDVFRFSELLASGFTPSVNKIFVGRTVEDNEDVFVSAYDLCHVAFSGKSGGGKGSLMRLLMVQLCSIGAHVLLLNPHYMKWVRAQQGGREFDEDWTPFDGNHSRTGKPYLEAPAMKCADMKPIEERLQWAVETLLAHRKAEGREGDKTFVPYFIVIDEYPDIVNEIMKAPKYLSKLLRQGRKYGIYVMVASQDFQQKTLGMEGMSTRKCFLTVFYTGGDTVTAKELLYEEAPKSIPENKLGKGVVLLRCVGTNNIAELVRVPFVDNESLYRLLGPSTFKKRLPQQQPRQEVNEASALEWDDETEQQRKTRTEPHQPQSITGVLRSLSAEEQMRYVRQMLYGQSGASQGDTAEPQTDMLHNSEPVEVEQEPATNITYMRRASGDSFDRPQEQTAGFNWGTQRQASAHQTPMPHPDPRAQQARVTNRQRAEAKVGEAYQLWQQGYNSVRKLQHITKWSDGLTREVVHIMENRGLVERDR